jgi:hypothetical protein
MRLLTTLCLVLLLGIAGCASREEAGRKQAANDDKQLGQAPEAGDQKGAEPGDIKDATTSDQAPLTAASEAEHRDRRAEKTIKVSGEVAEFHRGPDDEVDGIALKEGTEVRFPPKSGEKVVAIVSVGDQVEISGWTHAGESEVHAATVTNVGSGKSIEVDEPPPDSPQ